MTMRFYRIISAFALFLILGYEESRGQELATNQPLCDSLVVEDPDGSRTVTYTFQARPAEISAPQTSSLTKRQYLTSEADVEQKLLSLASRRMAPARVVSGQDLSGYSVGSIPIQASVSSTGARLYSIPISVVSGWKLVPELSLVYNSQSGNNIAGFGWGLSGLSSIEVRNKNYYYDGCYRGGVYDSSDAEYSLGWSAYCEICIRTIRIFLCDKKWKYSGAETPCLIRHCGLLYCFVSEWNDGNIRVFG